MVRQSTVRYYYIKPEKIHFLTFMLEAYEGVAVVTTVDRSRGIIMLQISPGQEDIVDAIIAWEGEKLGVRPFVKAEAGADSEKGDEGRNDEPGC